MTNKNSGFEEFATTDWNEIRKVLKDKKFADSSRGIGTTINLISYFGERLYNKLVLLAQDSEKIKEKLGNVIFLPGIMGTHLSIDDEIVWFNPISIFKGAMKKLKLGNDGQTNLGGFDVKTNSLISWYYAFALESLQATPFPYDWRLEININGDKLAQFIKEHFKEGEKNTLVAHSMGGLVSRAFILRHKEIWDQYQIKLIMLGTPNRGSFAAPQALMGQRCSEKGLAFIDQQQNLGELLSVISSFPGVYQLLPSPKTAPSLYEVKTWQDFPSSFSYENLIRARSFYEELENSNYLPYKDRLAYIAGFGQETPNSFHQNNDGKVVFEKTFDGDGTVSHQTGLLDGIATHFVQGEHSNLANYEIVLEAVKEFITAGTIDALPDKISRSARSRAANERNITPENLLEVTRDANEDLKCGMDIEPEVRMDAEQKLLGFLLGKQPKTVFINKTKTPRIKPKKHKIDLEVVFGDIASVNAPILAVGQYQNLPPKGASWAIDRAVGYKISLAFQSEMIGADLGQVFPVPVANLPGSKLKKNVKTVILAGMGAYQQVKREDIRYISMQIALSTLALGQKEFAMVLVGTSLASVSFDRAVISVLLGIYDALERFPNGEENQTENSELKVILVEWDEKRFREIERVTKEISKNQKNDATEKREGKDETPITENGNNLEKLLINLLESKKTAINNQTKEVISDEKVPYYVLTEQQKDVTRITIKRDYPNQTFLLSAITPTAAIPEREILVQNFIIDCLIEKIRFTSDIAKQEKYGRLLHAILIPEDFQTLIDTSKPLSLILNKEATAVPWEMVAYRSGNGVSTFGIELSLSRQFISLNARIPSIAPPLNKTFKVLIIADPASGDLHLEGARREGIMLKNFFEELKAKKDLNNDNDNQIEFQIDSYIGADECDIVKILSRIFTEDYDLIHFSGHGCFDEKDDTGCGWVFGKDETTGKIRVLSAREIFRLRRIPRLVFSNACFSAQVVPDGDFSTEGTNKKMAGIAQAFFEHGIENYIGSGWQVDDSLAVIFAKSFYKAAITEKDSEEKDRNLYKTISQAFSEAREKIRQANNQEGNSTWGAYQHYGDANTRLVR